MYDRDWSTKLVNDLRLVPGILLAASLLSSVQQFEVLHNIPKAKSLFQPTSTQTP